jgi:quinoprotein glucose dehydrogenase
MRIFAVLALASCALAQQNYSGWSVAGGGTENLHYSSLNQINTKNVDKLHVAWTFDSHDAYPQSDIQCNPIVIDQVMYLTSPKLRVIAVEAKSGKQIWSYDASKEGRAPNYNRGLTYWTDGQQSRILFTAGTDLISLDAKTGKLAAGFGQNGKVDMREAFNPPLGDTSLTVTSPGVIYKDLIILGSSTSETLPATPGDIRAYDVRNGKLCWTFHTIPRPGEFGYDTWPPDAWKKSGAANNWTGLVVDVKRGLAYIPTGSAAFDYYGADRHGDDLFADTLLCLDAATGKRKWHFQAIRHDVWDLDFPSPPTLITVRSKGQLVDAVAQAGKDGYIYVLNRDTGESLFPLNETPVPASSVDGESLAKTEPLPTKPAPFVRTELTEDMATTRTPQAHEAAVKAIRSMDHGQLFTSASLRGSIFFPGMAGGAEWGGSAYDPETHIYYINANELAWTIRLQKPEEIHHEAKTSQIYRYRCAPCHGQDMKGAPPEVPALDHVSDHLNDEQLSRILHNGQGRMPAFKSLGEPTIKALQGYLLRKQDTSVAIGGRYDRTPQLKYTVDGFQKFYDPDGYPATTPPWGTLSAINLDTGDYIWKQPLGEYPELVKKGLKNTGTENHGGAVVTAGGLLFIGATHWDNKFRAYDKLTGKLLWETVLPFAANATPSTYQIDGKQYVVVAEGGGRGLPSGGSYVAFSLP